MCVCICVCTVLQVSIDSLSWEFHVSHLDDSNLTEPPKVRSHCRCTEASHPTYVHACTCPAVSNVPAVCASIRSES